MSAPATTNSHGSDTLTEGIRVRVVPSYVSAQSDPSQGKYLFTYQITIANEGRLRARLRSRRWLIVDADGEQHEVRGPGVVGQTPDLGPGEQFEYSSFCPLGTPWGTMEGTYEFEREDGSVVDVLVGRFYLVGPR